MVRVARRASATVWERPVLSLVIVGAVGSCQAPPEVTPPLQMSSSSGDGTATSTGDPTPDRVPLEPFVLPPGCGDGVIVPGQYDCFFPVSLDWVEEELDGHMNLYPLDLDDDGRDEMIAYSGVSNIAVLRWDDHDLRLGPLVESAGSTTSPVQTRWDWNGDGLRDVAVLRQSLQPAVRVHHNLGGENIGEKEIVFEMPPSNDPSGFAGANGFALLDVEGDGTPEVLISMIADGHESANPSEELVLLRHTGTTWNVVGEVYPWGPCGLLSAYALGDFDGDGDEDIAVLDHGQSCDPFPTSYDPEWYRVGVLLANADEGVLELGGWYPTGGVVKFPTIWAEDVTGDGHIDLIVEIDEPLEYGVAVLRGLGNGTFDEGSPVDLSPVMPSYSARALIDIDGDSQREWMATLLDGRPWAIPLDFSPSRIAPMVALNDPEQGGSTRFTEAVGDINADGIGDYRVRAVQGRYHGDFLMVSAP